MIRRARRIRPTTTAALGGRSGPAAGLIVEEPAQISPASQPYISMLLGLGQLHRHVGRSAHHALAAITVGAAFNQGLQHQKKLLGKHGNPHSKWLKVIKLLRREGESFDELTGR